MDDTPDWGGAAARSQLSGLPWYLRPRPRPPRNTMALIANEGPEKEEGRISGDLLRHPTRGGPPVLVGRGKREKA